MILHDFDGVHICSDLFILKVQSALDMFLTLLSVVRGKFGGNLALKGWMSGTF